MTVFIVYSNRVAGGIRGHDYACISEFVDTIMRAKRI